MPAQTARERYVGWAFAQTLLGPWERPPGSNRNDYSKDLDRGADAWCVDFGQAGLKATGSDGGMLPTRSTREHIAWAKETGRYRAPGDPRRGAFAGVAKNGTSVHTDACVIQASTRRLIAIGGNTSNRGGSTADGGGVYANDRTYMLGNGTYRIYGYSEPFWGITRTDALHIQSTLGVPRTGYIDARTIAAVRRFQASKGLTADGYPGPTTYAALGGTITQEDTMAGLTPAQDAALAAIFTAMPRLLQIGEWLVPKVDQISKETARTHQIAELSDINLNGAGRVAALSGEVAGVKAALEQLAGGTQIDMAAITAAAEKGAKDGATSVSAEDVAAKLTVQAKQ